jgi:dihydrofolate reductase
MRHDHIDEYRVCVVAVVLGAGTWLFKPAAERMRMDLASTRPLVSGGVILTYRPRRSD